MPIDLLAVNAGIAPALTSVDGGAPRSGHATPERFVSPAPESRTMSPYMSSTRATSISHAESQTQEPSNSNSNPNTNTNEQYSLRRSSAATTTRSSRASTREHSVSRASDTSASSSSAAAPNQRAASGSSKAAAAAASKAAPFSSLGIVNLVARDAVLASKLIPTAAAPSGDELVAAVNGANGRAGAAVPELLVLGVPTVGAKSRVETQIKITLALVRPQRGIKREDDGVGVVGIGKAAWILPDGGLDERAAQELERVETWTHLRLPKHLALKSKEKKSGTAAVVKPKPSHPGRSYFSRLGQRREGGGPCTHADLRLISSVPDPAPESTLNLDVAVVSASDPTQRIYICSNCEQRELKRSLRRKDSKGKTFTAPIPIPDPNDPPRNEDEERQKVVVFNAQEVVDFQTGEVVLPTRVTCYCRHHKEKKGFWYVRRPFYMFENAGRSRLICLSRATQHHLRCAGSSRSSGRRGYEPSHHDHGRPQNQHEQGRCSSCRRRRQRAGFRRGRLGSEAERQQIRRCFRRQGQKRQGRFASGDYESVAARHVRSVAARSDRI